MKMARVAACIAAALVLAAGAAGAATPWSGTQIIDAGTGHGAFSPEVAVNAAGSGVAVFNQSNGLATSVYANRFSPESGWGGPALIDSGAGFNAQGGPVAIDAQGDIIAVFTDYDGALSRHRIMANRYANGWSGAVLIDNGGAEDAWSFSVAGDANGNAVAVFTQKSGANYRVYARRFVAGDGWQGAAQLIDAGDQDSRDVAVAMNAGGEACALFTQGPGGLEKVYANRYAPGSGWSGAVPIDVGTADGSMTPQAAVASDGTAFAVWRKGSPGRVYANRWAGGAWGGPVEIDSGSGQQARDPSIAADAQGGAVAAFTQQDEVGDVEHVCANRFSGGSWSGATRVDSGNGQAAMEASVALGADGSGFVVFKQSDGTVDHVWANRYVAGSGWAGAAIIDSMTGMGAEAPKVAVDGNGDALAVFQDAEGALSRVRANRWPAPPIDLKVNKNEFAPSDHIAVTADVQAVGTPFYPFVRLILPDASVLYYEAGKGLSGVPVPYLAGGPFTLADPIPGYPIVEANFAGIAPGTYLLEGGAVDATRTTSVDNLICVGGVDTETLIVQ